MTKASAVFIGIDGGGTGSRARVRDARGRLLAEATGGPANTYQDLPGSLRNLAALVADAAQAAGVPPGRLHAGLGLAGLETSVDPRAISAESLGVARAVARVDAHTACLGAFAGGDGGIVIAGTGSIAYGIWQGRVSLLGGWGLPVGDQGSGGWLGLEAVRRTALSIDGMGPATALTRHVMAAAGQNKMALSLWTERASPGDYGAFAPAMFDLAAQGDDSALGIVRAGATEIGRLVTSLAATGPTAICLLGGLSRSYRPYLASNVLALLQEPKLDAMEGALYLAGLRA